MLRVRVQIGNGRSGFVVVDDVLLLGSDGCSRNLCGWLWEKWDGRNKYRENTFTRWDFVDIVIGVECIVEN